MSGFLDNSNDYHGLLSDFSELTVLKTTSVGTRKAFVISINNLLKVMNLQRQFTLDYNHHSHADSKQCRRGSVVAFRLLSSTDWKLGIVKSTFPLNDPPVVDLFKWTGRVSSPGFPEFDSLKEIGEWSDISFHFTL